MPKTTTTPDPEVTARTQRRRFTAEQKRRILPSFDSNIMSNPKARRAIEDKR